MSMTITYKTRDVTVRFSVSVIVDLCYCWFVLLLLLICVTVGFTSQFLLVLLW